jgi:hypothetical protein
MAVKHLASQAKYIFAHHDDIVAFPVLIEPEGYPPCCFTRQPAFAVSPAEGRMRLGIRETGGVDFIVGFKKFQNDLRTRFM